MNVPSGPGTPRRPQRPEAEAEATAQGRSGPWEEDITRLATFEDYEENKDRPGFILQGPQEPMVQMKIEAIPLTYWWTLT
jgi:hypothetical protein